MASNVVVKEGLLVGKTVRIIDEAAGERFFGMQGKVVSYTTFSKDTLRLRRGDHECDVPLHAIAFG